MSEEKIQGSPYPRGFYPDIDVNGPDVSDMIMVTYGDDNYSSEESKELFAELFTNQKTGISSTNLEDVIQKDRRFVIVKPDDIGFYNSIDKENDVFLIYLVTLKKENGSYHWETVRTIYMLRNGVVYGFGDDFKIKLLRDTPYDICGQAVLSQNGNHTYKNYGIGARETAFEYFGGLKSMYTSKHNTNRTFILFEFSGDIWEVLAKLGEKSWKVSESVILNIGGKYNRDYDDSLQMGIPEEAYKAMEFFVRNVMMYADRTSLNCLQMLWSFHVSILQKYEDCGVQRTFKPIFSFRYPIEKTEIQLIEVERVWYKENQRIAENIPGYTVWRDEDLSGTPFEYSIAITDEFIKALGEEYKRLNGSSYLTDVTVLDGFNLRQLADDFQDVYVCSVNKTVVCDARLAKDPLAEKLVKKIKEMMDKETDDSRKRRLRSTMNIVIFYSSNEQNEMVYGRVNKQQTELHKMLGVPKYLVDKAICCGQLGLINKVKEIFGDDEENREYLQRLDDKTCDKLIDVSTSEELTIFFDKRQCLGRLVAFKGVKGLKKYIDFIESLQQEDRIFFTFYTQALADDAKTDRMFTDMKWNLKGKDLKDAYDTINAILHLKKIDEDNTLRKQFKEREKRWEKYLYSDENFQVLYPKRPEDIVLEGVNLTHCAKEFLVPVSKGETDMLFIRENDYPDIPFFTLEVKNGAIRQCHGFANSNVEPGSDLDDFLKKFCKEKNITYQIGNKALGVME